MPKRHMSLAGWQRTTHALVIIGQNVLLSLRDIGGLEVYRQELALPPWLRDEGRYAGFSADDTEALLAVPAAGDVGLDAMLRMAPAPAAGWVGKTVTFLSAAAGLRAAWLGGVDAAQLTGGENLIVTPSNWSRARLVAFGLPAAKIHVVPLGVNRAEYFLLHDRTRRQMRRPGGFAADEVVFLHIGAPFARKGLDLLLRALVVLRQQKCRARLLLKDQSQAYGRSMMAYNAAAAGQMPALREEAVFGAISIIDETLEHPKMRGLYGMADAMFRRIAPPGLICRCRRRLPAGCR